MNNDEELIQRLLGKGPKPPMFDTCKEAAERLDELLEDLIACRVEIHRKEKKIRYLEKKLGAESVEYVTAQDWVTIDL